jgi:hypothetical protein
VEVRTPSYPFAGASLIVIEDKQETQDELDLDGNKMVKSPLNQVLLKAPSSNFRVKCLLLHYTTI